MATTGIRYTIAVNVFVWILLAGLGIAWFMAYEAEEFVVSLYWVVITGLAIGYGDVVATDATG